MAYTTYIQWIILKFPFHVFTSSRPGPAREDGRQDQGGKKTNNQASFGGSILKANMEVEAAIELAHDSDLDDSETGIMMHRCWIARCFARFA